MRAPMHPADEFEAFKELVEKGIPVADVAARFGVTETVVQKRLRLARVSPVLLGCFRRGDMTLEHLMASTVTNDHALRRNAFGTNCPNGGNNIPTVSAPLSPRMKSPLKTYECDS